jgi:hypothetical protein
MELFNIDGCYNFVSSKCRSEDDFNFLGYVGTKRFSRLFVGYYNYFKPDRLPKAI